MRHSSLLLFFALFAVSVSAKPVINQITIDGSYLRIFGESLVSKSKDRVYIAIDGTNEVYEPQVMTATKTYVEVYLETIPPAGQYRLFINKNEKSRSTDALVIFGTIGPQGPEGPQGPQGLAGADGQNGEPGVAGPAGPPGATGATGSAGPAGAAGPAGTDGSDGADGEPYLGDIPNGNIVVGDGLENLADQNPDDFGDPTGRFNTAVGVGALLSADTGYDNVGVGFLALNELTSGYGNIGVGLYALRVNTTGVNNTAVGRDALGSNISGSDNVGVGGGALLQLNVGRLNTVLGVNAASNMTQGWFNTAVGNESLMTNLTGSGNTVLGRGADVAFSDLENATALGRGAIVTASNTVQLGSDNLELVSTSAPVKMGQVTYPNYDGLSGQVLITDGAGELQWGDVSEAINGAEVMGQISNLESRLVEQSHIIDQLMQRLEDAGL